MTLSSLLRTAWVVPLVGLGCTGEPDDSTDTGDPTGPAASCAIAPLATCVEDYSAALAACYAENGVDCPDGAGTTAALDALATSLGDCSVAGLDAEATVGRLQNACASEASSLAWRSFGGPQGAAWAEANDNQRTCLASAHEAGAELVVGTLEEVDACLQGGTCDELPGARNDLQSTARSAVDEVCELLPNRIAVSARTFVQRAAQQADCLAAAAVDEADELGLSCGPSFAAFEAPRGEWTQVVVPSDVWGTQCADGSDYAFQVRLAPEGQPLDRVVIGLQGGGVCLFEEDCAARQKSNPELFSALDDEPSSTGIMSTDPAVSSFADYTMVYLPYCTQDVFAGGGVDEELGEITVPRYGAVNARAALQMFRDVLWREMDAEGGAGFRPDEVVALFGGFSAGGYGTLYNYHWMLDDLQWPRTIAYPDAGLAVDTGGALGVGGLGLVKIPAWGTEAYLPPYCFDGECAVGEVLFQAISPRLRTVPEQQILAVTNQYDAIQARDAFFSDDASFINALRGSYCRTRDLPGIEYYFTSVSEESVHVVTLREELWVGAVDGVAMRDWFSAAVNNPTSLTDRVEEADFVTAIDGVEPFPCDVAP